MIITAKSIKGINKQCSDDSILIGDTLISDNYISCEVVGDSIVAVADGVGGNAGGALASKFVLSSLKEQIMFDENESKLMDLMDNINYQLVKYSNECDSMNKMATTLSAILFYNHEVYIVHVGNTRIYKIQGRFIKQLTLDQTTKKYYEMQGYIIAADSCNPNEIYSCMGGGDSLLMKLQQCNKIGKMDDFSSFVISSDGLHDYITIDFMETILQQNISDEDRINRLFDEAQKAGSPDDMSIVIVRI